MKKLLFALSLIVALASVTLFVPSSANATAVPVKAEPAITPFQGGTFDIPPTTYLPCFDSNEVPSNDVPDCGKCYLGEGTTVDWDCIDNARADLKACLKAACTRHNQRCRDAKAARDAAFDAAISAFLQCSSTATTPAEVQTCADISDASIAAANHTLEVAQLASSIVYSADTNDCDNDYLAKAAECCRDCDPWEGWND